MSMHQRNDRSWHTEDKRIREALKALDARKQTSAPTSHTPGPWLSVRGTIGTPSFHIAEMMPSAYPDLPPCFAPAEQQEANARLIVAAPDMLDALRATSESLDEWATNSLPDLEELAGLRDTVRAAIAKAEGK